MGATSERAVKLDANITARRQRSSERLLQNLADAMPRERSQPTLKQEQAKGGIPAARGEVRRDYQPGSQGSGGIAGPLVEGLALDPGAPLEPVLARETYPLVELHTSDGLFVFEITPYKKITFVDANGDAVPVIIANAYEEPEEE